MAKTTKTQMSNEINDKLHTEIDWTRLKLRDLETWYGIVKDPSQQVGKIVGDEVQEVAEVGKQFIGDFIDEKVQKLKKELLG